MAAGGPWCNLSRVTGYAVCGIAGLAGGRVSCNGHRLHWETQVRQADRRAAQQVWQEAKRLLADPHVDLLLLDELTYMVAFDYLDLDEVLTALVQRPANQHVIITGRGCHRALLVSWPIRSAKSKTSKHAFDAGIKAQKGIDW
jgi:cob(I)alamin adenosyltransferase